MKLVFLHGWSATSLNTYGDLPALLANPETNGGLNVQISHIRLGRYISFHDEVRMDDLVRALEVALRETFEAGADDDLPQFAAIAHSAGAPLLKIWNRKHYADQTNNPLTHIVNLAPAMQGSGWAKYGRETLGKIKAFFEDVEPGLGVLEWLEPGSQGIWDLAQGRLADVGDAAARPFEFTIIGDKIDYPIFKPIFNLAGERGTDGTIRLAGANLNFAHLSARESDSKLEDQVEKRERQWLSIKRKARLRNIVYLGPEQLKVVEDRAFQVVANTSHFSPKTGIMTSVNAKNYQEKAAYGWLLKALAVGSAVDYATLRSGMHVATQAYQAQVSSSGKRKNGRYTMLVFRVRDDQGRAIDDYLMTLLKVSKNGTPSSEMPEDFFVHRHMNPKTHQLVYYVDADVMAQIKNFAMLIEAFPDEGFAYYEPLEIRWTGATEELIRPNQTIFIDVTLNRKVTKQTLDFVRPDEKKKSFKNMPHGKLLIDGKQSVQ